MKNTSTQKKKNNSGAANTKTVPFLKASLLAVFGLLLLSSTLQAQKPRNNYVHPALGTSIMSSGNGHGTFYSPYVSITSNSHSFLLGVLLHKAEAKLSGLKVTYVKNLSGAGNPQHKDLLQINFYSYLQYNKQTSLSKSLVRNEQMIHRDRGTDWSQVKYQTVEGGCGIELDINITNNFTWRNFIGAAAYNHLNYIQGMDHEKIAPTLNLGTAIQFTL